jgi:DnaD/phage-associated family protein
MSFDGFPKNVLVTPVPDPLFNSLLEQIEDLAELKVTLRAIWLLGQKRGAFRTLNEDELLNDPSLLKGVKSLDGSPQERLRQGLEQAVTRGTLLRHLPESASDSRSNTATDKPIYLLNTEAGRRELARRQAGSGVTPDAEHRLAYAEPDSAEPAADTRPNIFALYEDTIATLDPYIAERLKEAEQRYPPGWIREAFEIAATENKRSWRYVAAILARWGAEGKGNLAGGKKEDGEPGRNISQDRRGKYSKDYERYRGRSGSRPASR